MRGDDQLPCGSDCEDAIAQLESFLDGELPETRLEDIEAHLKACYPCTDRAVFEEQIRAIVRRDCLEAAPAEVVERIRAHLTGLPFPQDDPT